MMEQVMSIGFVDGRLTVVDTESSEVLLTASIDWPDTWEQYDRAVEMLTEMFKDAVIERLVNEPGAPGGTGS